jgi:hypothetical protein
MVDCGFCIVDILINDKSRPSSILSRAPAKKEGFQELLMGARKEGQGQIITQSETNSRSEAVGIKAQPTALCIKPTHAVIQKAHHCLNLMHVIATETSYRAAS